MKKWILVSMLTIFSATAGASLITFEQISAGDAGSAENPIEVTNLYDIYLTVDEPFFAIDVIVKVSGPAEIVSATGKAEAEDFGWGYEPSENPIYGTDNVEIGLASEISGVKMSGRAAKVTLKALDVGQVQLSISNGTSFPNPSQDYLFRDPDISGNLTIYQAAPEPMTIALLGLGGILVRKK